MIAVEIYDCEIDQLEALGLLAASDRSSAAALKPALERVTEVVLRPKWRALIDAMLSDPVTK